MFLFLNRCVYRASVCARTASDALVCIDNVLAVTLSDAANGASICASAAADALIGNFVSHLEKPPLKFVHLYSITTLKKIKGI